MSFRRSLFLNLKSQLHCMPRRQAVVSFSSMWGSESGSNKEPNEVQWETQIKDFQSEKYRALNLRQRIRSVCSEIESGANLLGSNFILVSLSTGPPTPDVLEMVKEPINLLSELYLKLGKIIQETPDEYYRYHNEWSSVTRTVVSMLAFIHWIETGSLLLHSEAKEKLWSKSLEFELDVEDYLYGLYIMSSDLPRYVLRQERAWNQDFSNKAVALLATIQHAFRLISYLNDNLRTQLDEVVNGLGNTSKHHLGYGNVAERPCLLRNDEGLLSNDYMRHHPGTAQNWPLNRTSYN